MSLHVYDNQHFAELYEPLLIWSSKQTPRNVLKTLGNTLATTFNQASFAHISSENMKYVTLWIAEAVL